MSTIAQRSFAGGELAPAVYARTDTVKYQTGLRTMRNFILMRHGGAQSRPGTVFIGPCKESGRVPRLIPFIFNADQTYVLEFTHQAVRIIRDGAYVKETAQNISGITAANPCVITYAGSDNYANGDQVYISGVVGAIGPYVNNRWFTVAGLNAGANTFELNYISGGAVTSTSWGAYTSGGTVEEIYTITSPYGEDDLPDLQYVQSADVITIVHPSYAPRELTRTAHATWTLAEISFLPSITMSATSVSSITAGANTYKWKVTAVKADTYEESLPGLDSTSTTISAATAANPVVVTYVGADNYANEDEIYISGVVGMTELNGGTYVVANLNAGANTFSLKNTNGVAVDGSAYTAYSSGGTLARTYTKATSAAAPTAADPHVLTWTGVAAAIEYNVYQEADNGIFGLVGVAKSNTYNVIGTEPDTLETPPVANNPFDSAGNYPATVGLFQQRRLFASTDDDTEKVWASKTGFFKNFTISSPIQDDDSLSWSLAGRQVNEVRHLLDLGKLLALTSGGEWSIEGDTAGILKPAEINPKQYSYNGADLLPPLVIGGNALYVQARGSVVRDLAFDYQVDGYRGNDLTIFSAHLFEGYTLTDWTYQQVPHSVVWAVRNDGSLIALTYVREHQLWGWHRHDIEGATIESVCAVPEGDEDALYVVTKRTVSVGGSDVTMRYIERLSTRSVGDIEDYIGMDCSLSYDGRNAAATTMTMSEYSSGGWLYTSTITVTASASTFASTDVGNAVHIEHTDGTVIRVTITEYVSATVVRGKPHQTVPVAMRAVSYTTWTDAVDSLTGLWHLEGEQVSVFADGFVVANPNNASYTAITVTNGSITLDRPYGVIHVGLPITCDVETLDIDTANGESIADKKKMVQRVSMHVESSRGIWVGAKPPDDDDVDPLQGLMEVRSRSTEGYESPPALQTGVVTVNIQPQWNSNGRVFVRQVDPVPLSMLAIIPSGLFPFPRG